MSTGDDKTDVLVIGGGPVGMTVAAELARHGLRPRVFERKPGPVQHSHASILHVRTQEVFDAMGVEGFIERGHFFEQMVLRAFGKRLGAIQLSGVDSPRPGPIDIWQSHTEALLLTHLGKLGIAVERPVEVVSVRVEEAFTEAVIRHADGREETARAPWIIGCEGSSSLVRNTLGIPFEGFRYEQREFVQTDARVRWSYPAGKGYAFIEEDRFMGFFPYDANGFYRVLCAREDRDPSNRQPPTIEEMQQLVREVADPDAELHDVAWLNRFRTQHKIAKQFRSGRALIAGDAAHVHVPVAGQGMNTGIQDAFNLAWKLAAVHQGRAPAALLDTYHAERHPVAESLLRFTDRGFRILVQPGGLAGFGLRTLAPLGLELDAVQERARAVIEQVAVAYPDSPLTEEHARGNGPQAGERAPHAVVVRGTDRQTVSLFEAMKGTSWSLLLFPGKPGRKGTEAARELSALGAEVGKRYPDVRAFLLAQEPSQGAEGVGFLLHDRESSAHQAYGAEEPLLCLIRPDGYLGWRGGLGAAQSLRAYLGRWLHAQA